MSLGSDSPGGSPEGIGGDESGIGGGSGGNSEGGFGGLGIGNPGSYGGSNVPAEASPNAVDNDSLVSQNMALGVAMAQSDMQAVQNNMEMGLASNPSMGAEQIGNSMMDFTGLSNQQQTDAYGKQADYDMSRDLSTRSLMDQWSAYRTAKKLGADTSPNAQGLGLTAAKGVIDFATGQMPMGLGDMTNAFADRTPGQLGVDLGYADLSQQLSRGVANPESKYDSAPSGGVAGSEQEMIRSLAERMSRPSSKIRGV